MPRQCPVRTRNLFVWRVPGLAGDTVPGRAITGRIGLGRTDAEPYPCIACYRKLNADGVRTGCIFLFINMVMQVRCLYRN